MAPRGPKPTQLQLESVPRCIDCAYCLHGLDDPRCPECGRPFDLNDPATFTNKPPLVRWRLWLPGLALSIACGVLIFVAIILGGGQIGWAATLATPIAIGAILGYRCLVRPIAKVLLALSALTGIMVALFSLRISGLLCSLIAFAVAFGPMLVGALLGHLLRRKLKRSRFSQRSYLPVLLLALLPLSLAAVENQLQIAPEPSVVRTSRTIRAPLDRVWDSIRFYEQLENDKPLLFRLGAPEPIGTQGNLDRPGDIQTCVYRKGHVRKRLRQSDFGRAIVFDVIEQHIGFERSVRLRSGSFEFESLGPESTRLTLQTEYDALLRPRWSWSVAERHILRTLHEYILDGIEQEALRTDTTRPDTAQLAYGHH